MVTKAITIRNAAPVKVPAVVRVTVKATPASKVAAAKTTQRAAAGRLVKKPAPVAGPAISSPVQPKIAKPVKEKKSKLVRNRFTILKAEYGVLGELKQRAGKLAMPAKRSELLRAGIKALAAMTDNAFLATLKSVPAIKPGRSAKP